MQSSVAVELSSGALSSAVAICESAFFVVPCGYLGFGALGELPPCFRHLEKQRLVAIVSG
jgi:hypothetical protein